MEDNEMPVACSLTPGDTEARRDEWRRLLEANLVEREVIPGGIRLLLRPSAAAATQVKRLAELEQGCCAWINWSIDEGATLAVDATAAEPEGTQLLRAWFG